MSIEVNYKKINTKHSFNSVYAFIDTDGDFYLVEENNEKVVCLTNTGCVVYDVKDYATIEEFFNKELSCDLLKVYEDNDDYEIIING